MSGYRLPHDRGVALDRKRAFEFRFNGKRIRAFKGDTVASAILAEGILLVGRSFKLHRPRGIFTCGVEEPTGILDIGVADERTPNTRLTDLDACAGLETRTGNAWPSLKFDVGSATTLIGGLVPAGFYYKTFIWPNWHLFEPLIRRAAGLGHASNAPDPDRYEEVSRNVEVLVIGAGAAGIHAALAAKSVGREVLILESLPTADEWRTSVGSSTASDALGSLKASGIELLTRCTAIGIYDHGLVCANEVVPHQPVRERLWKIRARHIIVATGAFERPMLFPDNDRPGVMLANAVERYATRYGVACGRAVLLATACDSAYAVATTLVGAGVNVVGIVDRREQCALPAPDGVPVHRGAAIVAVKGKSCVRSVTIASLSGSWSKDVDTDCVASAGGWTPAVNLYSMAGGKLRWIDDASMFVPDLDVPGVSMVGACAGIFAPDAVLRHAEAIGRGESPIAPVGGLGPVPADNTPTAAALSKAKASIGKTFVDLQNDVTTADIALAARENYRSVEHLKRYTTMGMATDQGKTSNVNALVAMGVETGRAPAKVGTTKFRPPFRPVTLNALSVGRSGARYRPVKHLPAEAWHREHGAVFEDFGGWMRPATYPQTGESLLEAAQREALHVRTSVGLFDASPLGKIEVYGRDAAAFLDLMYVGTMSTLSIGQARYGLLLDENGIIFDDGIVARLSDEHFWVNTTSGGVDRVALAFEEWLQCEFVGHRVLITPITSNWGNVTVAGPSAWRLLRSAGFDESLSPGTMKHMTMRQVMYGGVAMRVMRASFSGELSYEINLPALHTQSLLARLSAVGGPTNVRPYGVEAVDILRTEKGFIHLGSDTDGTSQPSDVELDRGIGKKAANFVGRRSLMRSGANDANRLQLVGLLPIDRRSLVPIGAHLTTGDRGQAIDGYVTSSCYSPILAHPIALAMLKGGLRRHGERTSVRHLGSRIPVEIVKPSFFDPTGKKIDGDG